MGRELIPAELRELLGAYALDALDSEERDQVDRFVERDADARAEVAGLREVAAWLVQPDGEAPDTLWGRIEDALAERPPRLTFQAAPSLRRPRRALRATAAGIAAVMTAAVVVLAVRVSDQESRIDRLGAGMEHQGLRQAAGAARADPDATVLPLASSDGRLHAQVVLMPDGAGYLFPGDLEALPPGRTYQLWVAGGDPSRPDHRSAGVLGRSPAVSAFRTSGTVLGFLVTIERAQGAAHSDETPVVEGWL